jgi:hypothetical protein
MLRCMMGSGDQRTRRSQGELRRGQGAQAKRRSIEVLQAGRQAVSAMSGIPYA